MRRFLVSRLPIDGLQLVERSIHADRRGLFARLFCADELAAAGWEKPVMQINHSHTSNSGTVRGLHFQRQPSLEMKLVHCIRGAIWDVAVDIRRGSPTYLCWHGECLSAENGRALLIPEGCAHGFQALTDDVEMIYCHSACYAPADEGALHPLDPRLAIAWPQAVSELSARDANHPLLAEIEFAGVLL